MSQVIVTNDRLKERRERSAQQERKIARDEMFQRWKRNDITKRGPMMRVWGIVFLPPLAVWYVLAALIGVASWLARGIFKALGQMVGGSKNLITGK